MISHAPPAEIPSAIIPPNAHPTEISHLSHSQVTSFQMCPRKWHYEKVKRAPREILPVPLAFGIALHDTLAAVNEAAMQGETVPGADLFRHHWTTATAGELPIHFGKDSADVLLAKGLALVGAYMPPTGIIGIEQAFSVILAEDLPPIVGRIDLIRQNAAGELVLADLKSSGTRVLADTHSVSAQLGLYDIAYPAAQHEAIVFGKLATPTITIQPITPWQPKRLVQHYREIYSAMMAGVRYAVRGWACDACPYAKLCKSDDS